MKVPEVIFLQWHGDAPTTYFDDDDNEIPLPEDELEEVKPDDVTWCIDRIFDADIVYRRADLTCRWTQYEDRGWRPGCGKGADPESDQPEGPPRYVWDLVYCPYCANRIEIKEDTDE